MDTWDKNLVIICWFYVKNGTFVHITDKIFLVTCPPLETHGSHWPPKVEVLEPSLPINRWPCQMSAYCFDRLMSSLLKLIGLQHKPKRQYRSLSFSNTRQVAPICTLLNTWTYVYESLSPQTVLQLEFSIGSAVFAWLTQTCNQRIDRHRQKHRPICHDMCRNSQQCACIPLSTSKFLQCWRCRHLRSNWHWKWQLYNNSFATN